jgi:DNA-binding NarL/FixJ family response regulator
MDSSEKLIQVIIADSQFLITESLKYILISDGHFNVKNIVEEKVELLRELESGQISLLIIDHSLIDIPGISELKEIIKRFPDLKVLILTNNLSKSELNELNTNGFNNVILKTTDKTELREAINSTLKGKKYYSNELFDLFFDVTKRNNNAEENRLLTNSEIEIVRLIADGMTTKEIAAHKFISFHTVMSHRKNIFRKLSVTSVSELIMYAIKAGWIDNIEYYI